MKALYPKTYKKERRFFLLPGSELGWEAWSVSQDGQSQKLENNPLNDAQLSKVEAASFGIPARLVHSVPIWIYSQDEQSNQSALSLQLESMEILGKGKGFSVYDLSLVRKESDRFLYSVGLLNRGLPASFGTYHHNYDVSTRFFRFKPDQVTLWIEHGRITVAFTRGTCVVHFQDLGESSLTDHVIHDLACIKLGLELREAIDDIKAVCVWFSASPSEIKKLETLLNVPVVQEPKPSPVLPSKPWALIPPEIVAAKKSARWNRLKWKVAFIVGALYFGIVCVLLFNLQRTYSALQQKQKWLADHQEAIDAVKKSDAAWADLHLILDVDHFPLENLLHCTSAITGDDFHLTLFDQENGDFIVRGEGKNATAAAFFAHQLVKDTALKRYSWKVDAPTILPNDLAQIELRAYAPSNP